MADQSVGVPAPEPPDPPASGDRVETFAAIVRNGLSNGHIAQSSATWDQLNIRLGEIVAAILKEI